MASDISNSNGTTAFMGGVSTGGFLKAASDALDAIDDPVSGMLTGVLSGVKSQIKDADRRIAEKQDQVDALEARLLEQMAAADAAIASMEQQYSYLSNMFEIMSKDSE
jgi:flagellar capping protein FliD